MAVVGMPLLAVTVLHASTVAVAAITASAYLPWLIIGLPGGAWVDRLPCRRLMITCDIMSFTFYASLPASAWAGELTIAQVIAVALAAGSVSVLFTTAYRVLLPSLVAPEDLIEGNAKLQGSAAAATIGGRAASGIAAEALGAATALLFNAASFAVSAACLLAIRPAASPPRAARPATTLRAEIAEGTRFIRRDPYLRPLTLYGCAANLAYSGSTALVVLLLVRVIGLGPAAAGLLLAVSGFGGIGGALAARRLARRAGSARALLLCAAAGGLSGLLIPLAGPGPRAAFFAAGATTVAAAIAVSNIVIGSFRQAYCPPALLGRVTATMSLLVRAGIPLGALAAGAIAAAVGVRGALWILMTCFALSAALLATPAIRSARDLPRQPAAAMSRAGR
jgi:predicted MFS family arabinose efflux permease